MLSLLAGIMISLGCMVYLMIGQPIGPFLFAFGLMSVLAFKFELFTGKAGLLATNQITPYNLLEIWCGNFCGAIATALLIIFTPIGVDLMNAARPIIETRIGNGFFVNLIYGIFCGILMYLAVTTYQKMNANPIYAILPVAIFIFCGFNHCVADMFYITVGCGDGWAYLTLVPTTIGNIIGCNSVPWILNIHHNHPDLLRK